MVKITSIFFWTLQEFGIYENKSNLKKIFIFQKTFEKLIDLTCLYMDNGVTTFRIVNYTISPYAYVYGSQFVYTFVLTFVYLPQIRAKVRVGTDWLTGWLQTYRETDGVNSWIFSEFSGIHELACVNKMFLEQFVKNLRLNWMAFRGEYFNSTHIRFFGHFENNFFQFFSFEHVEDEFLKTNPRLVLQETPLSRSLGSSVHYDGIFVHYNGISVHYDGIFVRYKRIIGHYDGITMQYHI